MKKLNNKGITTIEIIICFILIVAITMSMYGTISSFNEKRILEQEKEEIYSYKNLLTKDIQDDFIKIGIITATYKKDVVNDATTIHTVKCDLRDGTSRELVITQSFSKSEIHPEGIEGQEDVFTIEYGEPTDKTKYTLPNLGYADDNQKIKNLSINNVIIDIVDDNVLSIYIGFYHPDFETRYSISIVAPINYVSYNSVGIQAWTYAE